MKRIVRGLMWVALSCALAFCLLVLPGLSATNVKPSGHSHIAISYPEATAWDQQVHQVMDELTLDVSTPGSPEYNFHLQPKGRARIVTTIKQGNAAFVVALYSLRYPRPGCLGQLAVSTVEMQHSWGHTGWGARVTCISRIAPLDIVFNHAFGSHYRINVIYGRAMPTVRAVRIIRGRRSFLIPVKDTFFGIVGECSDVHLVQALDAYGRIVGALTGGTCPQSS